MILEYTLWEREGESRGREEDKMQDMHFFFFCWAANVQLIFSLWGFLCFFLGGAEPLTVSLTISLKSQTDTRWQIIITQHVCHPLCLHCPPICHQCRMKQTINSVYLTQVWWGKWSAAARTHLELGDGFHEGPVRAVATVWLIQQAVQHLPDCLPLVHHHGLGALVRHVDPDHQLRSKERVIIKSLDKRDTNMTPIL